MTDEDDDDKKFDLTDLHMFVNSELRLNDTDGYPGNLVQSVSIRLAFTDEVGDELLAIGKLNCFLLDVVSANNIEKFAGNLHDECDSSGEIFEFFEFAFNEHESIKGRLLQKIGEAPNATEDDVDSEFEIANVLCVSMGHWDLRPEVFMRTITRLSRVMKFEYVCVDAREVEGLSLLPAPFVKVMWRDIIEPGTTMFRNGSERWFYFGRVPADDDESLDETAKIEHPVDKDAVIKKLTRERDEARTEVDRLKSSSIDEYLKSVGEDVRQVIREADERRRRDP